MIITIISFIAPGACAAKTRYCYKCVLLKQGNDSPQENSNSIEEEVGNDSNVINSLTIANNDTTKELEKTGEETIEQRNETHLEELQEEIESTNIISEQEQRSEQEEDEQLIDKMIREDRQVEERVFPTEINAQQLVAIEYLWFINDY